MHPVRRATVLVVSVAAVAAIAVGVYAALSATGSSSSAAPSHATTPPEVDQATLDSLPPGRMLVRTVAPRAPRRDGDVYSLDADGVTKVGDFACKRVASSPAGTGLCLTIAENGIDYDAIVFDEKYKPVRRFAIDGVPDRARISADGRYGAYTTFESPDSQSYFNNTFEFSTNTRIVDMRTGKELLRLDDLDVPLSKARDQYRDSTPDFWGVTFAGGDRYYATMAKGSNRFLIKGRIGESRAQALGADIECPAISPDGTRIAFKLRIGGTTRWRLSVLDIASGRETRLAEKRSIDDQPEWIGNDLIAYSDDYSVFVVPADGSGKPRRLARRATSPTWVDAEPAASQRP